MSETVRLDVIYNSVGDISNIRTRIPGFIGSNSKYIPILKINTNIISTLKQFRVQRDEFNILSDILSYILSAQTEDIQRTFQLTDRQGIYTNKYLITGLGSSIQITNPILINVSPGILTFIINIVPHTKLAYIRHELINPLHTIKMSSSLIKDHNQDVDKLSKLISSKVDESLTLLDNLLAIGETSRLDPISIQSFITYINEYILSINQVYLQEIKPGIIWPLIPKSQFREQFTGGFIYVNICYIKVILDNIFKNIFGHLNNRITNREFRDFTIKIDSSPDNQNFTNLFIIIRNQITDTYSKPCKQPFVFSKLSSTSKLQGVYHLDPFSHVISNIPVKHESMSDPCGTGIRLIDELCTKMNIQWQINESDDDYTDRSSIISFTLKIPITQSIHMKTVHASIPLAVRA